MLVLIMTLALTAFACSDRDQEQIAHRTLYINDVPRPAVQTDSDRLPGLQPYPWAHGYLVNAAPQIDSLLGAYIDTHQRLPRSSGRYLLSELFDWKRQLKPENRELHMDTVLILNADSDTTRVTTFAQHVHVYYVSSFSVAVDSGQLITVYFNGRNAIDESGHGDDIILVQKLVYLDRLRPCRGFFH